MITFGSLFAGIGGFDLGLERAGMEARWQVELDPYCRKVLEKHWPNVRRHGDVKTFPPTPTKEWKVDLICGGFPCQPVSVAGKQQGDADDRWLWPEMRRVCETLRPRWVLAENVPGLLSAHAGRLFGGVVRDLAALGYAVEWDCIPAAAVGAVHRRDRVWIVAHSKRGRCGQAGKREGMGRVSENGPHNPGEVAESGDVADTARTHDRGREPKEGNGQVPQPGSRAVSQDVADPCRAGQSCRSDTGSTGAPRLAKGQQAEGGTIFADAGSLRGNTWWRTEPGLDRVADGVPNQVDRIRCLGNAVVPQVVEWIGRRIIDSA